jgi:hypothetical protein
MSAMTPAIPSPGQRAGRHHHDLGGHRAGLVAAGVGAGTLVPADGTGRALNYF